MKYLKSFNEAIVDWETDNIINFYNELKDRLSSSSNISFKDIKEVGDKNNIEVVDYNTFFEELPNEKMREDAPPKNTPAFALVNPITYKARIVLNVDSVDKKLLDIIYHMLKHENVHIGQNKNKIDKSKGEYLGDVRNIKDYFSNKDEVMAFAQSVSDLVMGMNPRSMEEAIKMMTKTPLWKAIKTTDKKIQNRYKKYIYLYLEKEFEKEKRKKKNTNKVSDESGVDIESEVNVLYTRYDSNTLSRKEFDDVVMDVLNSIQKLSDEDKKEELILKLREINKNLL
jgi:hypothetical protein